MAGLIKFTLVVLLLGMGSSIWSQGVTGKKMEKKQKRMEAFEQLQAMVNEKPIEFVAERAFPAGYSSVDLFSNPNHLRILGDSVFIHMPYFGRAFQVTPGERGGFHVDDIMYQRKITVDKEKYKVRFVFTVKENNDRYQCSLEIYGSGTATLHIVSNNRSTISYNGEVKEWVRDRDYK